MYYTEEDIDFKILNNFAKFEELCYDLLCKLDFKDLEWRRGGSDSGRDIEGTYNYNNPLVGNIKEKWFFECKYYTNGVPVSELSSKIDWAEAENADYLVIMTSSYITNSSRDWLNKMISRRNFKMYVLEEKDIKRIILNYNDIVEKYFLTPPVKLLKNSKSNWVNHNVYPQPNILYLFYKELNYDRLSLFDIAFLSCSYYASLDILDDWIEEEDNKFNFDLLYTHSEKYIEGSNMGASVLENLKIDNVVILSRGICKWSSYNEHILAKLTTDKSRSLYVFVKNEDIGYEYFIMAKNDNISKCNYIKSNVNESFSLAYSILYEIIKSNLE